MTSPQTGRDLVPSSDARSRSRAIFAARPLPRAHFEAVMIGVGVGDALGRPAEAKSPYEVQRRFGRITNYVPWPGWSGGPTGTITDDTQMTMCVAESIVTQGRVAPNDIAERFIRWLPEGRGKGKTCVAAIERLRAGYGWERSGVPSAGNGAAMRVAPVGLLHALRPTELRRDAAITAVITHADPMAVVSAVAQAAAVAFLLRGPSLGSSPKSMLDAVAVMVGDLRDPGHPERRPGSSSRRVRLLTRLQEVVGLLDAPPEVAFRHFHNGAFVLESLPVAWWCFLRYLDDPELALVTAANAGYDADTVASMAGALVGAYHGRGAFPERWLRELEYVEKLSELGADLNQLVVTAPVRTVVGRPHSVASWPV